MKKTIFKANKITLNDCLELAKKGYDVTFEFIDNELYIIITEKDKD